MHTIKSLEILWLFPIDLSPQCLLEDMSDHETLLFSEDGSKDLESDGEFDTRIILRGCESDRDDESRDSCERGWNCEDVFEVESKWIVSFFPNLPGDRRSCRCDDDIDLSKSLRKILTDQFSYTRSLSIVGIIEPRGEHIGSDHRATLGLRSESLDSILSDIMDSISTVTIANTIVASEIGCDFGRVDDVICRDSVLSMWE